MSRTRIPTIHFLWRADRFAVGLDQAGLSLLESHVPELDCCCRWREFGDAFQEPVEVAKHLVSLHANLADPYTALRDLCAEPPEAAADMEVA